MSMNKKIISLVIVFLLTSVSVVAEEYKLGEQYELLETPVPTRDPSKVEVVEVFWYGCIHCFKFESILQPWRHKLAADVDFWQSPAMWNERMKMHARAFYTAQALGVEEKMHLPLFQALNIDHKKLATEDEIGKFFAEYGVAEKDFKEVFNSFGVMNKVTQADARARGYKISGTPEIIVEGKYRINANKAGGQQGMLKVVDFLIEKERAAKQGAAS